MRKAESALSNYTREENALLKETESAVSKAMDGSGFFSKKGFNQILDNKIKESDKQIGEIFKLYGEEIDLIIDSMPKIGTKWKTDYSFENTEYEGDLNYSSENFNYDKSNSDLKFSFGFSNSDKTDNDKRDQITATNTESSKNDEYITGRNDTVVAIRAINNELITKFVCTNVEEIQANAFKGCPNLKLIVINKGIKKININSLRGVSDDCIIAFEDSRSDIELLLTDRKFLIGRKVVFNYSSSKQNFDEVESYQLTGEETCEKKIIIRKGTPLDSDKIKKLFLERNQKYSLNLEELNGGITKVGNNVDKDLILYEALLIRRKRALSDNSYWDYASALGYALKLAVKLEKIEEALSIIYGLLYLDSSGYRMVNGKYNPFMQPAEQMYYHPQMEFGDLCSIVENNNYTNEDLVNGYKNSVYVKELSDKFTHAYYSIEDSIKLMFMALEKPYSIFYPATSGVARKTEGGKK